MVQNKTGEKTVKKTASPKIVSIVGIADLDAKSPKKQTVSSDAYACAVRVALQNWRQGTVGCKARSEVKLSGKKPWKQKGTGRARAGSARSPIWRGGGVTFGPQKRVKTLKTTKKVRQAVCNMLAWHRIESDRVLALNWNLSGDTPKTSEAVKALKQAGLADKKVTLFVDMHDYKTHASFANVPNVQLLLFDQPNAYALSHGDYWVFLEQDREHFKQMVNAWI